MWRDAIQYSLEDTISTTVIVEDIQYCGGKPSQLNEMIAQKITLLHAMHHRNLSNASYKFENGLNLLQLQ